MWGNNVKKVTLTGNKIPNFKSWRKANPSSVYFDSMLEYDVYMYLQKHNINFKSHLQDKIIYAEAYETQVFYPSKKATKNIKSKKIIKGDIIPASIKTTKIQKKGYTPDFILYFNNQTIFLETKGFKTDVFILRYSMFRSILKDNESSFIIKNIKELRELIKLLL